MRRTTVRPCCGSPSPRSAAGRPATCAGLRARSSWWNTASRCAYTPQYKGLEALYARYRDAGLVVVGFPSNDFGGQEPGSNEKIADFCETTYGVKFPLHAKTSVTGAQAHPLYQRLRALTGEAPGWNFHKYLIDRSGTEVLSVSSQIAPESPALVSAIESRLAARSLPSPAHPQ